MSTNSSNDFRYHQSLKDFWLLFYQNKVALYSFYLLVGLIFIAFFAPFLAPHNPYQQFTQEVLSPPSWFKEGKISYFFGTDHLGRDIFSRLILGTRYTFGSAIIVTLVTASIGGGVCLWAGLSQKSSFGKISYLLESFIAIPSLLIAIVIATLIQVSLTNAIFAITLALLPSFIHTMAAKIRSELHRVDIVLLRLDNATPWQQFCACFYPNLLLCYVREVSKIFIFAIMDIAALSFLSLGAQSPMPEWGVLIKNSVNLIFLAPWQIILPGLAMILCILIWSFFTHGLCLTIEKYFE